MARLATTRTGRALLHLIALSVDHAWRFHVAGILREVY